MVTTADSSSALRTVLLALTVAIVGLVVGSILTLVAALAAFAVGLTQPTVLIVLAVVFTQGVAFGGVALVFLRRSGLGASFVPVRVPTLRDLLWVVGGYVLAFAAVAVGASLVLGTGADPASNQVSQLGMENPEVLLVLIPLSFLLVGPGEELLFRGVVQGLLRRVFGPVVGVTLASAIFAAIHWFALTGGAGARLATIGILFFPSMVFGGVYERTGNIAVPALIHGAYNATLFAAFYGALRFGEMPAILA
ncbi:CPBP family intramembrane glutamic endopeptidase [Halobacteriaceae archaeon GCM10025711]